MRSRYLFLLGITAVLSSLFAIPRAATAQCTPQWASFGGDIYGVNAAVVFDDGNGPALYVAGSFTLAGTPTRNYVAKWSGSSWQPLSSGLNGTAYALAVFDEDGAGPQPPALFVGGTFNRAGGNVAVGVARWNGSSWSSLNVGVSAVQQSQTVVNTLCVHDDGSGASLYVGGFFDTAGGINSPRIARWDGSTWHPLGPAIAPFGTSAGYVYSLASFDSDGSGPQPASLIIGGSFNTNGGSSFNRVCSWNGTTLAALGAGADGTVRQLAVLPELNNTNSLVAIGEFTSAGGVAAHRLARWNGASWASLPSLGGSRSPHIEGIGVADDGDGVALYVSTEQPRGVVRFAGGTWTSVLTLASSSGANYRFFDYLDPSSCTAPRKVLLGSEGSLSYLADGAWARWGGVLENTVRCMTPWTPAASEPSRQMLFLGGSFYLSPFSPSSGIGAWNGVELVPLGAGLAGTANMPAEVFATLPFQLPNAVSESLVVAGLFTSAGGSPAANIASWNGATWSAIGSGLTGNQPVKALAVFNEGTGNTLYAGGAFRVSSGAPASYLARWNGSAWQQVGAALDGQVNALAVFDDGSGPALYVGGDFIRIGGQVSPALARWDGTSLSPVPGTLGTFGGTTAMKVFDDGAGPALYIADLYTVHRLRSGSISTVGGTNAFSNYVQTLGQVDPDGSGSSPAQLYAGGTFSAVAGVPISNLARWNGSNWAAVGGGTQGTVLAIAAFDDDAGAAGTPALYLGGDLTSVGGASTNYFARYGCVVVPGPTFLSQPSDQAALLNATVSFQVDAAGIGSVAYAWQRNGAFLHDGVQPSGSIVSGSNTPLLSILNVQLGDLGEYRAIATQGCFTGESLPAELTLACAADHNADGFVDFNDFDSFVSNFEAGSVAADFNTDGFIDFTDFDEFVSAFEAGC